MAAHRKNTNRKVTTKKVFAVAGFGIGLSLISAPLASADGISVQTGSIVREVGEQPEAALTGTFVDAGSENTPKSSAGDYLGSYSKGPAVVAKPQTLAG